MIRDRILPDGLLGTCDVDAGIIEINPNQSDAEYRVTLTHEWIHWLRGDRPTGDPVLDAKMEAQVERIVAVALVPMRLLSRLLLTFGFDLHKIAEELGVDHATVKCRLMTLTSEEWATVGLALQKKEFAA